MQIHRSTVGVVVQAPAKLNLFFEVLAKRIDGYHEIETLMVPIDLYDTLSFTTDSSSQVSITCQKVSGVWGPQGESLGDVPEDATNLAVRAVELLRRRAGVTGGAHLRLVKRIPTAAGLGGGSSDAAAALVAANIGWKLCWPLERLLPLAAELGSDVPFFLGRGPAICKGRGEKISPVTGIGPLHFVVVRPPEGLSTATVYRSCQASSRPRNYRPLCAALAQGNISAGGRLLFNRLQSAAKKLSPWIHRLEEILSKEDCPGHLMSGSGTCYFGLCRHARHARRVARRLQARTIGLAFAVQGSR